MTKKGSFKKSVRSRKVEGQNYTEALREANKATHIGYLANDAHRAVAQEILPLLSKLKSVKWPLKDGRDGFENIPWVYDSEHGGMVFIHRDAFTPDAVLQIWFTKKFSIGQIYTDRMKKYPQYSNDIIHSAKVGYTKEVVPLSEANVAIVEFTLTANSSTSECLVIPLDSLRTTKKKIDYIAEQMSGDKYVKAVTEYFNAVSSGAEVSGGSYIKNYVAGLEPELSFNGMKYSTNVYGENNKPADVFYRSKNDGKLPKGIDHDMLVDIYRLGEKLSIRYNVNTLEEFLNLSNDSFPQTSIDDMIGSSLKNHWVTSTGQKTVWVDGVQTLRLIEGYFKFQAGADSMDVSIEEYLKK